MVGDAFGTFVKVDGPRKGLRRLFGRVQRQDFGAQLPHPLLGGLHAFWVARLQDKTA